MKRKVSLLLSGFIFMSSLSTGTAFASETLEDSVNDFIGIPYKWGGTSTSGMDCSGFILNVFNHFNIELPRTSKQQAKVGYKVEKDDLRPGDLVFFNTDGKGVSHAGIYIGDGKFAHSSSSKGVGISKMSQPYYANRYLTARRVTGATTYAHMIAEHASQ